MIQKSRRICARWAREADHDPLVPRAPVLSILQNVYIIKDSDLDMPDVPQPVAGRGRPEPIAPEAHDPEPIAPEDPKPIAPEATETAMQALVPLASSSAQENYVHKEDVMAMINKDLAPVSAPAEKRQRTEMEQLFDVVPDTAHAVSRSQQLELANGPRIIGRECSVALTRHPPHQMKYSCNNRC